MCQIGHELLQTKYMQDLKDPQKKLFFSKMSMFLLMIDTRIDRVRRIDGWVVGVLTKNV